MLRTPAHRVSPRAMAKWALDHLLAGAVLTACAYGLARWSEQAGWPWRPTWLPWAVGGVSLLLAATVPAWRYRFHRWEVSSDVVYTRVGWFTRQWLLVPVSRIQTVDAEQSWLERMLDLATIKISTASHEGSSELTGLRLTTATAIAADLAARAHDLHDDAT
ncbi:PH domain-containing protein [Actinocorallia lasiicapitis]